MAYVQPSRIKYRYSLAVRPDGTPYVGQYTDGTPYFNVLAWRADGASKDTYRIIARTPTLEQAQKLVKELTECTNGWPS